MSGYCENCVTNISSMAYTTRCINFFQEHLQLHFSSLSVYFLKINKLHEKQKESPLHWEDGSKLVKFETFEKMFGRSVQG